MDCRQARRLCLETDISAPADSLIYNRRWMHRYRIHGSDTGTVRIVFAGSWQQNRQVQSGMDAYYRPDGEQMLVSQKMKIPSAPWSSAGIYLLQRLAGNWMKYAAGILVALAWFAGYGPTEMFLLWKSNYTADTPAEKEECWWCIIHQNFRHNLILRIFAV